MSVEWALCSWGHVTTIFLKLFWVWKHLGNPLEMVRILFENPLWNVGGKTILQVCVHYPHAGECATADTTCYDFFFFRNVILRHVRYGFIYICGKIKRYNACETSPKFRSENFGHLRMQTSISYCLHERLTTLVICMLRNSAYVLSQLILKLSEVFEIILST